jgi:hypothetical protein
LTDALADLAVIMPDIPTESAARDWSYLAGQMKNDLFFRPERALDDMREALALLRHRQNARMYVVSNMPDREQMMGSIESLVSGLSDDGNPAIQQYSDLPIVQERMKSRYPGLNRPTYVGLINTNTRNGVFIYTSKCADLKETDENRLLDYLSARLYGGGGAHSMFMKTWGAGLAYSNGLRSNEQSGRLIYYAERCPDLTATMRFVTGELKKAPYDPKLAEYAVAQAFESNRGSNSYVSRGIAMANNLADGITPDVVEGFRQRVLELSKKDKLFDTLNERMERVYGTVLIGYGGRLAENNSNGNYFVIGPEAQFEKLEEFISAAEVEQPVYRIYPRDYWLTN